MKIRNLLIYLSVFTIILIAGNHINVNADSKQDNYNTNSQDIIILDNNNFNNISFPDASNKTEEIGSYVQSFVNKLNHTKLELKDAKKQLSNFNGKKTKNSALKRINKINNKLNKLNTSKTSILNDAKQAIKSAENKKNNAETDQEHINANVSLNRSKISYSELNKVLK